MKSFLYKLYNLSGDFIVTFMDIGTKKTIHSQNIELKCYNTKNITTYL